MLTLDALATAQRLVTESIKATPSGTTMWPATVVTAAAAGADVVLMLDGDTDTLITAQNITGLRLPTSARVMVLLAPPHGVFVTGFVGSAKAQTLLAEILLTADGAISFTDIPPDYTTLTVIGSVRSSAAAVSDFIFTRFNGDSGANQYIDERIDGATTVVSSSGAQRTGLIFGRVLGNNAAATFAAAIRLEIPNYSKTTFIKNATGQGSGSDTSASSFFHTTGGGVWRSTSVINQVDLFAFTTPFTWKSGSYVALLGS